MLRLDGAASVRLSVQLAGRCREVMSFLSGEEKVGKLLAASEILCAVTLNLALYWLIGARGGAKAVVGVLAFMVPLLLGSLLSPDILFIFRHLVPAVADDATDVSVVMLDSAIDFCFRPVGGAKNHECISGTWDMANRLARRFGRRGCSYW